MERNETVQEYYDLSMKFLKAALGNLESDLHEPALANAIHSLELSIKALLFVKIEGLIKIHNVGGLLGKHYRDELGMETCKRINRILMVYNIPRYPGVDAPDEEDVTADIDFIEDFVTSKVEFLIS